MKCKKCGAEINDSVKFCTNCGAEVSNKTQTVKQQAQNVTRAFETPVNQAVGNQTANGNQAPISEKPRKPWYKRWWVWLLMGLGTIILMFNMTCTCAMFMPSSSTNSNTSISKATESDKAVTPTEKTNEKPTEKVTEKPTEISKTNENIERDFKSSCKSIDFETLSRNPDKYKGNNFVLTGEVIQVTESSWLNKTVSLRINITKNEYEYIESDPYYTDTIYAEVEIPDGADRILEDDIITFWGTCDGMYSYTSVMGSKVSLPKIDIKYFQMAHCKMRLQQ